MLIRAVCAAVKRAIGTSAVDRSTLVAGVILSLATSATGLGTVHILFAKSQLLGGWTQSQAIVLYGIYIVFDGLAGTFLSPSLTRLPEQIQSGEFDASLLNPAGPQLLLTFAQLNPWRLPDIAMGALLVTMYRTSAAVDFVSAGLALLAALVLLYAYWLLLVSVTLSVSRTNNAAQLLVVPLSLGRFPLDVYPPWLKSVLMSVLPIGFITFVPAAVLTNALSGAWAMMGLLVAAVFAVFANVVFRHCIYRYTGA